MPFEYGIAPEEHIWFSTASWGNAQAELFLHNRTLQGDGGSIGPSDRPLT